MAPRLRQGRRGPAAAVLSAVVLAALSAGGPRDAFAGVGRGAPRGVRCQIRRAVAEAEAEALQAEATLDLIQEQVVQGHKLKDFGKQMKAAEFKASKLDGAVQVTMDGMQRLRSVELKEPLKAAGDDAKVLSQAVLEALQEAHDSSTAGTEDDVWGLYKENSALAQAPLAQLGAGSSAEDLWANVSKTEESVQLAEELFARFDEDKDGFWNMKETSEVQMATEGTGMREEDFKSLIIAAAPDGGRSLSEADLKKGLSRDQVIELYTDREKQRQLGFVLNIYQDHAKVFAQDAAAAEAAAAAPAEEEAAPADEPPAATSPLVD